jgi:hypothetical protein
MATNYNPRTVTDGLALCLDAANSKSSPIKTGTTGTVDFNGASSVTFGSSNDAAFGTGDFTVEFFIYNRNSSGLSRLCASNAGWWIEFGSSKAAWQNANGYLFYDGQSGGNILTGPPLNVWTHVAFTRASGSLRVFYDGVQKSVTLTDNVNYTSPSPSVLSLGDFGASGAFQHNGIISNFHIVKGTAKYTSNFTPPSTINIQTQSGTSILTANSSVSLAANGMTSIQGSPTVGSRSGTINSNSWDDLSGRGNNGTLANGPTYSSSNGGSIVFDGTDEYATVPSNSGWAFGGNGTVEQWVYVAGNSGGNDRFWCVNNNSTSLDAYLNGASYNIGFHGGVVLTTTTIPQNTWVHFVVVYTSGTIKVYFNTVEQGLTGTTTGYNITNNGTLYIGRYIIAPYELNGRISSMKIYNRALTASEIQQNFNVLRGRFGI